MKLKSLAVGIALAVGVAIAGCGGTSSSSSGGAASGASSSASSGGSNSGKTLVIWDSNYGTSSSTVGGSSTGHPEQVLGAQLAADEINAAGGINGAKVKVEACDTQSTITGEVACARQGVAAHPVIVINNAVDPLEDFPIYKSAGLPQIVDVSDTDAVSQASQKGWVFATDGHSLSPFLGLPFYMKDHGLSKLAAVVVDLPIAVTFVKALQAASKAAGVDYVGTYKIPLSGLTNPTAGAQQLKSMGADTVLFFTGTPQATPIVNAAQSLGVSSITWMSNCLVYSTSDLQAVDAQQQTKFLIGCPYPLATQNYPIMKQYVAALKQHGDLNPQNLRVEGPQAYMQVQAIAQIAKTIKGAITSESLRQAFNNAKDVSMGGLYKWTPTAPGPAGLPLLSSGQVYWYTTENFPSTHMLTPVNKQPLNLVDELK